MSHLQKRFNSSDGNHRAAATALGVVRGLDGAFPWRNALPEEPVGLLIGEREQPVERALLALDCHADIVAEARAREAQLILALLPPWSQPPVDWTSRTREGRLALLLAREGLGLVAGSTAWQAPPGGLCDAAMEHFQVRKLRPLQPSTVEPRTRIIIHVTADELTPVVDALVKAGVDEGRIAVSEVARPNRDRDDAVPYVEPAGEPLDQRAEPPQDAASAERAASAAAAESSSNNNNSSSAATTSSKGTSDKAGAGTARKTRRKSQTPAAAESKPDDDVEPRAEATTESTPTTTATSTTTTASPTPTPDSNEPAGHVIHPLTVLGATSAYCVELTVFEEQRKTLVTAASSMLPDQDARVDHVRLANTEKPLGLGRVGEMPSRLTAKRVTSDLNRLLRPVTLRVYGSPQEKFKRLAVSLRADAEAVSRAINYGAGCLIGGDLDYEGLRLAQDANLVVLDPGYVRLANWALTAIQAKLAAALPGVELLRSNHKSAYDG